jgi:hypothetical protein
VTRKEAELELARRQQALIQQLMNDGANLMLDVDALASSVGRRHPYLYLGGGVLTGTALTVAARKGWLGRLTRLATGTFRLVTAAGGMIPA